jgi:hypothetical protein
MIQHNGIQSTIKALGYEYSDQLIYLPQINNCKELTWHDKHVLTEISPYAVFLADGKILVAFFDDLSERESSNTEGKIWNAQIPIVISDEGDMIKIYSGRGMHLHQEKGIRLAPIQTCQFSECDEESSFSFWQITSQSDHYRNGTNHKNLNEFLIENLQFITERLKTEFHLKFANQFMLRILFIRYLIDRGINICYEGLTGEVTQSQEAFLHIVCNKEKLFGLFHYLKMRFNGNLFQIREDEYQEVNEPVLLLLHDFLTAKIQLASGQLCLFPFYDFNIIPIELISNIYEMLLGNERQDRDMAFYTPENLADYMVQQTLSLSLEKRVDFTLLDPSCGSGIFLVKSLRKLLEIYADENGYIQDKSISNRLIKERIYGVDVNEEAIDVTIFSLYVTLFDYQNPKDLADYKLPPLKNENIFNGDFFDDKKMSTLRSRRFDFVIGNPPWGDVKQENYIRYCEELNLVLPEKDICIAFMWRIREFVKENAACCLLLSSKILYRGKGPSKVFRRTLLSNVKLLHVLELSSVRKQIFHRASAPAVILHYSFADRSDQHKVEYISLKPNKYLELYGLVAIEANDIKYVKQQLFLEADNDWLWKTLVYGSFWDFEIMQSLNMKYEKIYNVIKKNKLLSGKGVQYHIGDGNDATHLMGKKLISSDECIDHFLLNMDNISLFSRPRIHRPRAKDLFEPPYLFFKKGLDTNDYTIKAVYTEEKLIYQETINCIKGTESQKKILLNLTGLFNSSLFSYFNLMCGSSAGIEREQVYLTELKKFPYVYSDELVSLVQEIQDRTVEFEDTEKLRNDLNTLVLKMYGLENNWFINYALQIQIPILCNKRRHSLLNAANMRLYAEIFYSTWSERLKRNGLQADIRLYPCIKRRFSAFEMSLRLGSSDLNIEIMENVDGDYELLTHLTVAKQNDFFYCIKDVAEFSENSFVILKPNDCKNWHPAMAIKDSYHVLNDVLKREEDAYERIPE